MLFCNWGPQTHPYTGSFTLPLEGPWGFLGKNHLFRLCQPIPSWGKHGGFVSAQCSRAQDPHTKGRSDDDSEFGVLVYTFKRLAQRPVNPASGLRRNPYKNGRKWKTVTRGTGVTKSPPFVTSRVSYSPIYFKFQEGAGGRFVCFYHVIAVIVAVFFVWLVFLCFCVEHHYFAFSHFFAIRKQKQTHWFFFGIWRL